MPLIEKYGAATVWQAGLETLGYPANWIHTNQEVITVASKLSQKGKEK